MSVNGELTKFAKVGTAGAPTTPGGKCLNDGDYAIWTKVETDGRDGFDLFVADLKS